VGGNGWSSAGVADVSQTMFDLIVRDVVAPRFGIRRSDRVLDVGCGGMPFAYATHLADLSLTDHSGRFGLPVPIGERPVYECSVEEMPFEDGEFDFVYCSHVLEHVGDPAAACRELMRVGRRGYVECPRSWTEIVFSAPDHRWLVDLECGVLVFREKLTLEAGDPLGLRFAIFPLLDQPAFRTHWDTPRMRRLRTVQLLWEGEFAFAVISAEERSGRRERPPVVPAAVRDAVVGAVFEALVPEAA
jgi:SAM-dependent methyltransferase